MVSAPYLRNISGNGGAKAASPWNEESLPVNIYNNRNLHVRLSAFCLDWWGLVEGNQIWFVFQSYPSGYYSDEIYVGTIYNGHFISGYTYKNGQKTESWTITR
jgi:hypothetical protein